MTAHPQLTIRGIRARAVDAPLVHPIRTAVGEVPSAPLVLIDLATEEGVLGRSYLFAYTPVTLRALVSLLDDLEPELVGKSVAPVDRMRELEMRLRLVGWQGLIGMAVGGIDMALWDALGHAAGRPVAALLGGEGTKLSDEQLDRIAELVKHSRAEKAGRAGKAGKAGQE